jgi:hypothetical protein
MVFIIDIIPATFYTLTIQRNGDKMVKKFMVYLNIVINTFCELQTNFM